MYFVFIFNFFLFITHLDSTNRVAVKDDLEHPKKFKKLKKHLKKRIRKNVQVVLFKPVHQFCKFQKQSKNTYFGRVRGGSPQKMFEDSVHQFCIYILYYIQHLLCILIKETFFYEKHISKSLLIYLPFSLKYFELVDFLRWAFPCKCFFH